MIKVISEIPYEGYVILLYSDGTCAVTSWDGVVAEGYIPSIEEAKNRIDANYEPDYGDGPEFDGWEDRIGD